MQSEKLKCLGITLPDTIPEMPVYELMTGIFPNHDDLTKKTLHRLSLLRDIISEYNRYSPTSELPLSDSSRAAEYMRTTFLGLDHEQAYAVYLNCRNRPIKKLLVSEGSATATTINEKRIIKEALLCGAISLILYHNHPSNHPLPSKSDIDHTESLKKALDVFDLHLLDHIIISSDGADYYSFSDQTISKLQNNG